MCSRKHTTHDLKVLAILYVGLPGFSRNDDGTKYATSVLRSGGTLTRVYGHVESLLMLNYSYLLINCIGSTSTSLMVLPNLQQTMSLVRISH